MRSPEVIINRTILIAVLLLLQTSAAAQGASQYRECSSAEREMYMQSLRQRLTSNWQVPSQYRDVTCAVVISLHFTGEVLNAAAEDCGGDPKLAKSAVDASYLSSPLPTPDNSACFERQVRVILRSKPDQIIGLRAIPLPGWLDKEAAVAIADHAHEHGYRQ